MKRLNRRQDARDLALGLIDEQVANLNKLRDLAATEELLNVANAIVEHTGNIDYGTPSIGDKSLNFSVYLYGLNKFTDPKLVNLNNTLKALDPDKSSFHEYKDYFSIDYRFEWEFEGDYRIAVVINAYEDSKTSECRKIQVGVKMVEQPIYRYDCVMPEGSSGELPAPVLNLEL